MNTTKKIRLYSLDEIKDEFILLGVQKAQISKLENNTTNVTMDTVLRVFNALKAKLSFRVVLQNKQIRVA